ncbi:MAG: proline dehydrogenase family protein [Candidatus Acidiferrales bacterium]
MGLMRSVLLAMSESAWLRDNAPKIGFVRRAVTRFMPGDDVASALAATRDLAPQRIGTVLTQLGENLTDPNQAHGVRQHYTSVYQQARAAGLDVEISAKLTQLGLDFSTDLCEQNLAALADCARQHNNWLWIDMESTAYTDRTLEIYRRLRAKFPNTGVCLQAYLYRTEDDAKSLLRAGGHIRLVKGAYREPPDKAFPKKRDVDANYFALAGLLLGPDAQRNGTRAIFGTHDAALIRRIESLARSNSVPAARLEFQMLYGIQRAEQARLAAAGHPFRVLISYGPAWYAWYMRRLAERPANILFVLKSLFSH